MRKALECRALNLFSQKKDSKYFILNPDYFHSYWLSAGLNSDTRITQNTEINNVYFIFTNAFELIV